MKRILLVVVGTLALGIGLMVYTVLGPFREFFWNIPYLAGFLGGREYLVLIQNNNELRPTGGFITAVAKVNMTFGVPSLEVFDSYNVPNPTPRIAAPEPFQYFIGQNDPFFAGLTLRDANFSPDFALSAQEVIALYQQAYPESTIDGVFSVDFTVMEELLDIYGPLKVEDISFTSHNFFIESQRISKDVDTHNVEALQNRKNILKPFGQQLIDSMIGEASKWGDLLEHLHDLMQRKHILAYSTSEAFQEKLERFGITHPIEDLNPQSDFLHVNIANIGGRKADRYMTKDIKYRADFSNPEKPQSILEITLEHLGSYNIQSDIYQAYIRVYAPLGTELISSSTGGLRNTTNTSDLNLQLFADYIRMKPGEKRTLTYSYQLPESILAENYQLKVVKQPGVQNQFWQFAVRQPNDSSMQNVSGSGMTPMEIKENIAIWRGDLITDRNFHIAKEADSSAPIILWQKFVDLKMINIRFQEQLEPTVAENINNYLIQDLNKENNQTDTIRITKAEFDERDLWLSIEGATLQPEEHYQIIIRDLQDMSGNMIQPNPLSRTLVQRIDQ